MRVQWLNALSSRTSPPAETIAVDAARGHALRRRPSWSPDGSRLAFYAQEADGLSLWVAERDGARAQDRGRAQRRVRHAVRSGCPTARRLIARARPRRSRRRRPSPRDAPTGPIVQESAGRTSAARTYEDLLGDAHDEALFDHYFTGQLARIDLAGAPPRRSARPALYRSFSVSPDGRYLLTERLKRPYSYLLPASFFPTEIAVSTIDGQPVKTLVDRPLADDLPVDFDADGKGSARGRVALRRARDAGLGGGARRRQPARQDRLPRQGDDAGRALRRRAGRAGADPGPLRDDDVGRRRFRDGRRSRMAHADRASPTRLRPSRPGQARTAADPQLSGPIWRSRLADAGGECRRQAGDALHPRARRRLRHRRWRDQGGRLSLPRHACRSRAASQTRLWTAKAPYYEPVVAMLDDTGTAHPDAARKREARPQLHHPHGEGRQREAGHAPSPIPRRCSRA